MEEKASSLPEFYIFRARAFYYLKQKGRTGKMPQINTRLRQKIDTEANWNKATNFIPLDGEIIIYKADENYSYERIKIGDGETTVINLAFVNSIDTNLTQSGQAADAKVVGDSVEDLYKRYLSMIKRVDGSRKFIIGDRKTYNEIGTSLPQEKSNHDTRSFNDSIPPEYLLHILKK